MKLYDCEVRLAGNLLHSVPKVGASEPELFLLRFMHGSDAIINLKRSGEREDHPEGVTGEYKRLATIYPVHQVERAFNIKLTDDDAWLREQLGEMDAAEVASAPKPQPQRAASSLDAAKQAAATLD